MRRWLLALAVLLVGLSVPVAAHESLPVIVRVVGDGASNYLVSLRTPGNIGADNRPSVVLRGSDCQHTGSGGRIYRFSCEEEPHAIDISWSRGTPPVPLIVEMSLPDQQDTAIVAQPGAVEVGLPYDRGFAPVLSSYFIFGLQHIIGGWDHLLFLTCLVLIARTVRRILVVITGFTAGHAITICWASLTTPQVNENGVEILIALSIAFLAAELARGASTTLSIRHAAPIAALFGLLHGLGFAGALAEFGLAHNQMIASLIGFNFGVEAGQLIFTAILFATIGLLRHLPIDAVQMRWVTSMAIGITAAFWLFERTGALLALA